MMLKNNEKQFAWNKAKELCDEVGLVGDAAKIPTAMIARMHLDPTSHSAIEPPPGYDDRLVASLLQKAEKLDAFATSRKPQHSVSHDAERAWFKLASGLIPATVFSFVFVIGFAVVQYFSTKNAADPQTDLWAKAVENASEVEVSRWLASVSDGGSQLFMTSSDFSVLSAELSEPQLEKALKESGGS